MTITLLVLFAAELNLHYNTNGAIDWKKTLTVMESFMAFEYGVLMLAFIPLFTAFMVVLKRSFETVYHRMKVRSSIAFTGFMILLIFRYVVYNLISFSSFRWVYAESVKGEIPLYISEIIIALCYLKLVVSLHQ